MMKVSRRHLIRYAIIPSKMDAGASIIGKANVNHVAELTKLNYT
jgi:hypothetical protein